MAIIVVPEEGQVELISRFNINHKYIPIVKRNQLSGWPLLQVSLYTQVEDTDGGVELYEPALGGGKCHSINIGAFNLACLLTSVPGPMCIELFGSRHKKIEKVREQVRMEFVGAFLHGYSITHLGVGVAISSKSNSYGYDVGVKAAEGNSDLLAGALSRVFSFAVKNESVVDLAMWNSPRYVSREIEESLDNDVAIFSNGQIFVDLGLFLVNSVKDKDLIQYFRDIFKVDQLQLCMLGLKVEVQNLRHSIDKMDVFGKKISASCSTGGQMAIALAAELHHQLNSFLSDSSGGGLDEGSFRLFMPEFEALLHSKDQLYTAYFASYKVVLANIQIALTEYSNSFERRNLRLPQATSRPGGQFFSKPDTKVELSPTVVPSFEATSTQR